MRTNSITPLEQLELLQLKPLDLTEVKSLFDVAAYAAHRYLYEHEDSGADEAYIAGLRLAGKLLSVLYNRLSTKDQHAVEHYISTASSSITEAVERGQKNKKEGITQIN